jgi:hypothetical protein
LAPTEACDVVCDQSLWGLESQVANIVNRMEGEVNVTITEIALEMEIIVLQNFDAASTALDAAVSAVLAPTDAILAE